MRVACVVPLYPPSSRVGAWLATHAYLRHLVTVGHTVDVYRYLTFGDDYDLDGVAVHSLPFKSIEADVFVGHLGDKGEAKRAANGRPLVQMVHGWVANLEGRLVGDAVVCNSHETAAWIGRGVVCEPITDPADYRHVASGDSVTLINLADSKGGRLFHLLAASMPHTPFLGVRGGWGKQFIRCTQNLSVIEPVEDIRTVWSETRVLVMPSERETWGMAGVEAMCCGIPVVAHPTPGLLESLGSAGIFVDRGDLAGWRAALDALADPDAWGEASANARDRADELAKSIPDRLARFAEVVEGLA